MTQKPRKGDFREFKSKKFPDGACSLVPLEARKLVSTYPRSALASDWSCREENCFRKSKALPRSG